MIVPTIGRPCLSRSLTSISEQLLPGDELVVVGDGVQPDARAAFQYAKSMQSFRGRAVYLEADCDRSVFGNFQRDCGMAEAIGDLVLFMDDDDVYVPGALQAVRRSAEAAPGRPLIFRARWGAGHHAHGVELWADPVVRVGNVATPMVALPNDRYAVCWMDGNDRGVVSDFEFLGAAIAEAGEPVWDETVVATVRPVVRS